MTNPTTTNPATVLSQSVSVPTSFPAGHRWPFGLEAPFNGLKMKQGGKWLINYTPNPKQWFAHNCSCDEIFYGGAPGGGKSWVINMHNGAHCLKWGKDARTIIFRRTYDELRRTSIDDLRKTFMPLGNYNEQDFRFDWHNGAVTFFRHLYEWKDVEKHDSAQYTLIAFDELTHFEERQYLALFKRRRKAEGGAHPQVISASNPKGLGHRWTYDRFVKDKVPYKPYEFVLAPMRLGGVWTPELRLTRVFIPAVLTDNTVLMKNDPEYLAAIAMSMPEREFQAFVSGDWSYFGGLAFPDWDQTVHVVEPFPIPADWKVIRCLDWGYETPFSVNWLAQDPKTKTIYVIAEWYGGQQSQSGGKVGVRVGPADFRSGVLDREAAAKMASNWPAPWYGVADPTMWRNDGGGCIADIVNMPGPALFIQADRGQAIDGKNPRLIRKTLFHSLFKIRPQTGKPGIQVFNTCRAFISQIAMLMLDEEDKENVAKKQEDHAWDSVGYGLVELIKATGSLNTVKDIDEVCRHYNVTPRGI